MNVQDWRGFTPLHWAASYGHKDVAGVLIEAGADVNAKDKENKTPLAFAVGKDHKELVELLKQHGAKE